MADLKISQLTGATTPLAGTEVVPVVQSGTTKKVSIANLTAGRSVGMQQANIAAAAGGSFGNPAWVADDGTGAMRLVFLAAPYAGVPAGKPWLHSYQDIYIGSDAGITVNFVSGGTTVSFDSGNLKPAAAKGVNFTANTPASGMTSQLLNWYEEGTFTATATGMTTSPTVTATYVRVGNNVTLNIPYIFGTSNDTSFTLTGMPTPLRPSAQRTVLCRAGDNSGANIVSCCDVNTSGVINIYKNANGDAFTASGTKGFQSSMSYVL